MSADMQFFGAVRALLTRHGCGCGVRPHLGRTPQGLQPNDGWLGMVSDQLVMEIGVPGIGLPLLSSVVTL